MELKVEGMSCGGCVSSVKRILTKQLEVPEDEVEVELAEGRAVVPDSVSDDKLAVALERLTAAGFPSTRAA